MTPVRARRLAGREGRDNAPGEVSPAHVGEARLAEERGELRLRDEPGDGVVQVAVGELPMAVFREEAGPQVHTGDEGQRGEEDGPVERPQRKSLDRRS